MGEAWLNRGTVEQVAVFGARWLSGGLGEVFALLWFGGHRRDTGG